MQENNLTSEYPPDLEILVVDDDKILTLLHKRQLERLSFPVRVYYNGKTALEYIKASPGTSFLVLLDIHMPQMNGWEFLETINNTPLKKEIKVVMVSSSITAADKHRALTYAQVIDYFAKPFTSVDLERLLEHGDLKEFFRPQLV